MLNIGEDQLVGKLVLVFNRETGELEEVQTDKKSESFAEMEPVSRKENLKHLVNNSDWTQHMHIEFYHAQNKSVCSMTINGKVFKYPC